MAFDHQRMLIVKSFYIEQQLIAQQRISTWLAQNYHLQGWICRFQRSWRPIRVALHFSPFEPGSSECSLQRLKHIQKNPWNIYLVNIIKHTLITKFKTNYLYKIISIATHLRNPMLVIVTLQAASKKLI